MLIPNTLFRMGGAAYVLSNRPRDRFRAKYVLRHLVRTHLGSDDEAYNAVIQREDDEGIVGRFTKAALERNGYRTVIFESAEACLAAWPGLADRCRALVTDQTMPGLQGTELAAELLTLKAKVNQGTLKDIILANRSKFTPALEKWALETYAADPSGLTAWLKAAPVLGAGANTEKQAKGGGAGGNSASGPAAASASC